MNTHPNTDPSNPGTDDAAAPPPARRRAVRADGPSPTPPPRSGRGHGHRGSRARAREGTPERPANDPPAVADPARPAPTPPWASPFPADGPLFTGYDAPEVPPDAPRWPHAPTAWPDQHKFSEQWMKGWLDAAGSTLSVAEACRVTGVGVAQYMMGRRNDLAFDQAALIFDQIVDLMILEAVRVKALDADVSAASLYFRVVRLPAFIPRFNSWTEPAPTHQPDPPLPGYVYDAMIAAGEAALQGPPPPGYGTYDDD